MRRGGSKESTRPRPAALPTTLDQVNIYGDPLSSRRVRPALRSASTPCRFDAIATWILSSLASSAPVGDCPVAYCSDHDAFFAMRSFERVENSVVADSPRPQRAQATQ